MPPLEQIIEFITNHWITVGAFMFLLGLLAVNLLQGQGKTVLSPQRAVHMFNRENAIAVDVRSEADFRKGHIVNAVQLTMEDIKDGARKLQKHKTKPLIVYCDSGNQAVAAAKALGGAGFENVYRLNGGLAAWRSENLPVEQGA